MKTFAVLIPFFALFAFLGQSFGLGEDDGPSNLRTLSTSPKGGGSPKTPPNGGGSGKVSLEEFNANIRSLTTPYTGIQTFTQDQLICLMGCSSSTVPYCSQACIGTAPTLLPTSVPTSVPTRFPTNAPTYSPKLISCCNSFCNSKKGNGYPSGIDASNCPPACYAKPTNVVFSYATIGRNALNPTATASLGNSGC